MYPRRVNLLHHNLLLLLAAGHIGEERITETALTQELGLLRNDMLPQMDMDESTTICQTRANLSKYNKNPFWGPRLYVPKIPIQTFKPVLLPAWAYWHTDTTM